MNDEDRALTEKIMKQREMFLALDEHYRETTMKLETEVEELERAVAELKKQRDYTRRTAGTNKKYSARSMS